MAQKTVLIVDDEQMYLEALADALQAVSIRILRASTVESALKILETEIVHAATIDMMIPPGDSLEGRVDSQKAGLYLCREILRKHPKVKAFCVTVINDRQMIQDIRQLGFGFMSKGDTPLKKVIETLLDAMKNMQDIPGVPQKRTGRPQLRNPWQT
jgi:DNA-binding NarL/FixJ family response regulator